MNKDKPTLLQSSFALVNVNLGCLNSLNILSLMVNTCRYHKCIS